MVNTKVRSPEIPVFTTIEFSNREGLKEQLEKNGIEETKKEQDLIEEIMHGLEKDRTYTIRFTKLEWKKLIEYEKLSTQNEIQQWRREFWNQKRAQLRENYVAQKKSLFERFRGMLHLTKDTFEQGADIIDDTKDKTADAKEKYENTKEVVQTVKKGGILSLLTLGGASGLFGWRKAKEKLTQEFKIHTKLKLTQWTLKVFGWVPFLGSFLRKKEGEFKDELKALKEKYERKEEKWKKKEVDKKTQQTQEEKIENVSEKKEEEEGTPENLIEHPALKILGASAGTIVGFAGIRKALEKMDTIPGVSTAVTPLLKAGNFLGIKGQLLRPLATLGTAGLVLVATIKIQQHLEKHPELLTKRDPDASWWKNILDSVHSLTDAEKGYTLPILTGEKNIDEYDLDLAEANAHPEGYVPLSFHVENATNEVQEQVYHIQDFIKEHPAFSGVMGLLLAKRIGISGLALGSMSAVNLSLKLAKAATWWMPFVALFGVLAYLQGRRVLHASVPKDPEAFKAYLINNKKDILGFCQEHELALAETKIGEIDDTYLMMAGHLIAAPGAIAEVVNNWTGKVMNVTGKLAEKIGNTPLELETKRNIDGLEMMIIKLKRKKDPSLEPLIKKVKDLRTNVLNIDVDTCDITQNPIVTSDIQNLKQEAEKHNIAIDMFHGYVTWSFFTEIDDERVYDGFSRLCIDPSIESPQKRKDLATQFQIDTSMSVPGLAFDFGEAITNDALIYLNAIGKAIQEGDDAEAASMFEYLQQTRWVRLIMVGTDFFLEGAKQKMIDLPKDLGLLLLGVVNKEHGINAQEFVLRTGNGLIPMVVFSTLREHFLNPLHFTKENRSLIKRLGFTPKHIIKEGTIAPLKAFNTYSRATRNILKDIVTLKPTKTISHIVRTEWLRYLHLHMDIMSKMPGTQLGDRYLDIAETIRTKFRIQQLQSNLSEFTRSGMSRRELGKKIEELLTRSNIEKLQVGGREMTKTQIVQAVRSKKKNILQDLIDGLDTKITTRHNVIKKEYLEALKNNKLTGGITRITERALSRAGLKTEKIEAFKKVIGKNPKITSWISKLISNGIPPAMAAIMIYDLHTNEDKRNTAIEHTTFLAAFWGGQKATSKITKNPIIGIMGGLATALGIQMGADFPSIVESKLEEYGGEKFSRACDSHLTNIATRLEILTGIQWLKNMVPSEPIEKMLLITGLPKGVEIVAKQMLRPVAVKLARKINTGLIRTALRMAGKKLGAVTAGTVASSWVPGLNIAMLAWTGYEVIQLGRMMHKTHKTNKLFDAQGEKDIESMHFDARTENVLSDAYVKDFPGEDFRSLSEDEQTKYASNILADEDRFNSLAYCNMTIERADQTSEVMEFEQGEPVYIEIRTKEETIKLSEDDLGEAENWEAPTSFTPKNITKEKYQQLDADESFAKLFYTTEALALRNTTKWTQLMVNPTDTRNIEIMRTRKQGEKIIMTRGGDDTWKLTSKQGELASGLDLYQALALANLNLYIDDFIESKVYGESDKKWLPENETKQPFRFKKDKIIYAKDNARHVAIVGNDNNWMDFYTKNLKLTPTTIVTSLNTHFQL